MTEITRGIKGRGQHSKFSVAALRNSLNRGRAVFLASSQLQLSFGRVHSIVYIQNKEMRESVDCRVQYDIAKNLCPP